MGRAQPGRQKFQSYRSPIHPLQPFWGVLCAKELQNANRNIFRMRRICIRMEAVCEERRMPQGKWRSYLPVAKTSPHSEEYRDGISRVEHNRRSTPFRFDDEETASE